MISPWSPPAWMKNTKNLRGGELEKKYYSAYALYLQKILSHIEDQGLSIKNMTILNEPLIGEARESWSFPQSFMSVEDQKDFVSNYLKPLLVKKKLTTEILAHDHNWDNADEVVKEIQNKNSKYSKSVGGVAYHCYGGDLESLKTSIHKHPNVAAFNTECSGTFGGGSMDGDFQWWLQTQSLDSIREGVSGSLGWNLCLDQNGGPHNGGCSTCRGLLTIDHDQQKNKIIKNPEYYAFAQTSRYVKPGAHVIESSDSHKDGLENVAFENPDGSIVLVIRNSGDQKKVSQINYDGCNMGATEIPPHGATSLIISQSLKY